MAIVWETVSSAPMALSEGRNGGPAIGVAGGAELLVDVAGRDDIDRFGFPPGIGEDGAIGYGTDLAMCSHL